MQYTVWTLVRLFWTVEISPSWRLTVAFPQVGKFHLGRDELSGFDRGGEALHRVFPVGGLDEIQQGHEGLHTVDSVLARSKVVCLTLVQDKLVGDKLFHH